MIYTAYKYGNGELAPEIETINELRKQKPLFFSAGAMKFFNSVIETEIQFHNLFITSERQDDQPKRYTIRIVLYSDLPNSADIWITRIGDFQQYKTLKAAQKDLLRYADGREIGDTDAKKINIRKDIIEPSLCGVFQRDDEFQN